MSTDQTELLTGKKTFFVVPEVSLFPEDYTKNYFLKGFESYFLDDDPYFRLELKIHTLFALFSEVILFFNIERSVRGIDWPQFIRSLQKTYGDRAMIGVMFRRKNDLEETRKLERLYLYEIGINGGCIPIEYQKTKNLYLFLNVLVANQANGQRKHLRALCGSACKMNLRYGGQQFQGELKDLSISHFSCVFSGEAPEIPLHEKICDIQMNLHGILMNVDGVICLKRNTDNSLIHVFVFRTDDGREGLSPENLARVNEIIFNIFRTNMNSLLKAEFDDAVRVLREKRERVVPDVLASVQENPETVAVEDIVALLASL